MSAGTVGRLKVLAQTVNVWLVPDTVCQRDGTYPADRVALVTSELDKADARRLAACWNACEGVPTEAIEQAAVNTGPLLANKLAECDALRDAAVQSGEEFDLVRTQLTNARLLLAEARETVDELQNVKAENARLAIELATAIAAVPNVVPGTDYAEIVRSLAEDVVKVAGIMRIVLTVSQRPLLPLAMGHYETIVEVRPARVMAEPIVRGAQ